MEKIKSDSWKKILDSAVCTVFPFDILQKVDINRANLRTSIHKDIDEERMNSDTYRRTNGKVTGQINYSED